MFQLLNPLFQLGSHRLSQQHISSLRGNHLDNHLGGQQHYPQIQPVSHHHSLHLFQQDSQQYYPHQIQHYSQHLILRDNLQFYRVQNQQFFHRPNQPLSQLPSLPLNQLLSRQVFQLFNPVVFLQVNQLVFQQIVRQDSRLVGLLLLLVNLPHNLRVSHRVFLCLFQLVNQLLSLRQYPLINQVALRLDSQQFYLHRTLVCNQLQNQQASPLLNHLALQLPYLLMFQLGSLHRNHLLIRLGNLLVPLLLFQPTSQPAYQPLSHHASQLWFHQDNQLADLLRNRPHSQRVNHQHSPQANHQGNLPLIRLVLPVTLSGLLELRVLVLMHFMELHGYQRKKWY